MASALRTENLAEIQDKNYPWYWSSMPVVVVPEDVQSIVSHWVAWIDASRRRLRSSIPSMHNWPLSSSHRCVYSCCDRGVRLQANKRRYMESIKTPARHAQIVTHSSRDRRFVLCLNIFHLVDVHRCISILLFIRDGWTVNAAARGHMRVKLWNNRINQNKLQAAAMKASSLRMRSHYCALSPYRY